MSTGTKRVVVTGMAGITSLGSDWPTIESKLRGAVSGIQAMPQWDRYKDINTRLAGPLPDFAAPKHYTRKALRTWAAWRCSACAAPNWR